MRRTAAYILLILAALSWASRNGLLDNLPVNPFVPAPIAEAKFNVLLIEETEDREKLNQDQANLIDSLVWREYVESKGGDWQSLDVHAPGELPKWQEAMKRPRTSLPWVIVSNGNTGFEGPLPATIDELMALLRTYGE